MAEARIFHLSMNVRDLDTSVRFYDMLGFRSVHRERLSESVVESTLEKLGEVGRNGAEYALMRLGAAPTATCIDLVQWDQLIEMPEPKVHQSGISRIAIQVEDPASLLAKLAGAGVQLAGPPGKNAPLEQDANEMFAFRDPDGVMIEVVSGLDHLVTD
jgi:catechol 2,3-dioxygenase-like lactoylglutathione lyase family enzyme